VIRLGTAIASAAFVVDASEPLSCVVGFALAIVCLWALAPERSR
jgi:hypothetical protein